MIQEGTEGHRAFKNQTLKQSSTMRGNNCRCSRKSKDQVNLARKQKKKMFESRDARLDDRHSVGKKDGGERKRKRGDWLTLFQPPTISSYVTVSDLA